ncbi:MAG: caspase family protein [Fibrobacter sp.]|nr:caspase family protein [Fibrobacter sp.]
MSIDRYVFAIGANDGGKDRVKLRYAESDAASFVKVMTEMGGVKKENSVVLKNPSAQALKDELFRLNEKMKGNKKYGNRQEIMVYYSGHADTEGLRLGAQVLSWKEFRNTVDKMDADVKIAVLDACGSGAITRLKGGVSVPAFMVDESSDMKGYAFITSSTQNESSQESDQIKGSFFTHSLVSGLRGAGDLSGDGKVTLSESYQFAFNETLQKTQGTMGGVQHPSRDMNLAGTGDVVMTDLRNTNANITFEKKLEGRLFIRDARGELVAELYKKGDREISLGLAGGSYKIELLKSDNSFKKAEIALNGSVLVKENQFALSEKSQTVSRGGENVCIPVNENDTNALYVYNQCIAQERLDSLDREGKSHITFNFVDAEHEPRKGSQFGLLVTSSEDNIIGSQLSLFANIAKKNLIGFQVTTIANYATHLEGAQLSPVVNIAGPLSKHKDGESSVSDTSEGVQISASVNVASQLSGAQIAPLNIAKFTDVQVGSVNIGSEIPIQVSAINVNGSVGTVQAGIINVAKSAEGRMIGIINVAGHADKSPIGLINVVGNGVWNLSANIDEMGNTALNLKLGTAYWYTAFEMGRILKEDNLFEYQDIYLSGIGVGTQFGRYGTHFGLEYMLLDCFDDWQTEKDYGLFHHRLRFYGTYKLLAGLGITSGIALNLVTEGYADRIPEGPRGKWHDNFSVDGHSARFWPGFFAGITVGKF